MLNWTSSSFFGRILKTAFHIFLLGIDLKVLFAQYAAEASGIGESQWRNFKNCGKNLPIKKLYDREKYFKVFIFFLIDLCEICQKKLKSLFASAWHSCRNENQKTWNILLLKLLNLQFYRKKFEGSRLSKFIRSRDLSKKFVTAIENTCAKTLSFIAKVVSIQASWETWCHNTIF